MFDIAVEVEWGEHVSGSAQNMDYAGWVGTRPTKASTKRAFPLCRALTLTPNAEEMRKHAPSSTPPPLLVTQIPSSGFLLSLTHSNTRRRVVPRGTGQREGWPAFPGRLGRVHPRRGRS